MGRPQLDRHVVRGMSLEERFWHYTYCDPNTGCWIWGGTISVRTGYGKLGANYREHAAHRLSYEIHKGPIPDGLLVCHTCDNRWCVNPDHLFAGTYSDNNKDCAAKGRGSMCWRSGETNHKAALSEWGVRQVRGLLRVGVSHSAICTMFGVSRSTISLIASRRTWRHV